jgi:aminoglycoside 6-adenylyltransferase
MENVGEALLTFLEPTSTGDDTERRVLFKGMLDIDFAIIPKAKAQKLLKRKISPEIANVFGRGVRVLLDKDGLMAQLLSRVPPSESLVPHVPTKDEFIQVVSDFLHHAVWTTKKLQRGELWTAKACCDGYMKRLLLQMIEWHFHATDKGKRDVWFSGRFLEEWAEPRILEGLSGVFAHYDLEDVKNALLATMDMFCCVAIETAEKLEYVYPSETDERVTDWVRKNLSRERPRRERRRFLRTVSVCLQGDVWNLVFPEGFCNILK